MQKALRYIFPTAVLIALVWPLPSLPDPIRTPEIVVVGTVEAGVDFWKTRDFWGIEDHDKDLIVPRALTVVVNKGWKQEANQLPVADKKELFYRALLPLILYANELILKDRHDLESIADKHSGGLTLTSNDLDWLQQLATHYRIIKGDPSEDEISPAEIPGLITELLLRVDSIPPSLALGQGAYESGYGTSRFSLEGNALFGQWTWGGKGIKPLQQRSSKGDYKVAAYDWPLDSVRAYMLNLNTQRSYEELRQQRASMRQRDEPLSGQALASALSRYSEKGQEYVKTLQGIIRVNQLDIADAARLRDEPLILIVSVDSETEAASLRKEIQDMQTSDELDGVIREMGLDAYSPVQ